MRDICIGVANWLCGTLEGISRENGDLALAEALDAWLRFQKNERRTLYTGRVTCAWCGFSWETLIASDDVQSRCPQCGRLQKTVRLPLPPQPMTREDREALDTIRKGMDEVVARLVSLNKSIQ